MSRAEMILIFSFLTVNTANSSRFNLVRPSQSFSGELISNPLMLFLHVNLCKLIKFSESHELVRRKTIFN